MPYVSIFYDEEKFRNYAEIFVYPTIFLMNKFSHFHPKTRSPRKLIPLRYIFIQHLVKSKQHQQQQQQQQKNK